MINVGKFVVSGEFLAQALHLPEGSEILEVKGSGNPFQVEFEFTVKGEGIKGPRTGEKVRLIRPWFKSVREKGMHDEVRFVSWE